MRLWHKNMVSSLPRQQLLGQWRECCCIASNIAKNGTPNHILVNKVMEYPVNHFFTYCMQYVVQEMIDRGYKVDTTKFWKHFPRQQSYTPVIHTELYDKWHNDRYYNQCYINLEEKYDCGGITEAEWLRLN